ncbi:hypothetical protein [Halalkalibacter sp. APA_J-10(15)]|uniref:SHOCT-like domain-containing protein n=1 Tax=unclassified Halalkalibacter TaxID=2893063 RepID=UPI001FF427E5|nr:hypothetical protein [Halalkalibacter sp. APA_J-10(15)]MCK0470457.1 hypothetical protein [Halalkalibacter sp. APA_J-10(15)]
MKDEIAKVLNMVQEGKIDAKEGTELIELLKQEETETATKQSEYLKKTLKIRIHSEDNENVSVNLPIKLVKVVLVAGHSIASKIPQSEQYVKDLDIGLIIEAIDNELEGQIVDVKSSNGDTVSVIIE